MAIANPYIVKVFVVVKDQAKAKEIGQKIFELLKDADSSLIDIQVLDALTATKPSNE